MLRCVVLVNMRVFLVVAVFGAALYFWSAPADASCAAPQVEVTPNEARPGDTVHVSGGGFADRCNDTRVCYTDGTCEPVEPAKPDRDIRINLSLTGDEVKSETWHLATVDADERFRISVDVRIPDDVPPGKAFVTYSSEPLTILPPSAPAPSPTTTPTQSARPTPSPEPTPIAMIEPTSSSSPAPEARSSSAVPAVAVAGGATVLSAGALVLRRLSG